MNNNTRALTQPTRDGGIEVNATGPRHMTREQCSLPRLVIAVICVVSALWTPAVFGAAGPNIVIILADDMGYGDVSCYNPDSKIQTPHIDRLAKQGVRFTDAHSGGSSCIPSRYALMTGRFAVRKPMSLAGGPLIDAKRMTLPGMLRKHGYATAMVGKWHLGFDPFLQNKQKPADYSKPLRGGPVDRGFDSYFGMHASLDLPPYFYIRDRTPTAPPTDDAPANSSVGGPEGWNNIQGAFWRAGKVGPDFKFDQVTPRFAQEAVKVIKDHGAKKSNKPLFLYLALPSPHTPWLPADRFKGKSGAGMYGDFVLQVDDVVGQVMDALKATGMDRDTLVLFTSDNGPVWYDKDRQRFKHDAVGGLRGMKFASWEGGHRMPFVIRWPAKIAPAFEIKPRRNAGHVCDQPVVFSDLYATFAQLINAKPTPKGTAEDSVSFLPHLLDPTRPVSKRPPIIHDRWTIRDGDWKLILPRRNHREKTKSPLALYNLKTDLAEQRNLAEQHPQVVNRLKKQLEHALNK